jgi:tubulin polyglutamylase TTLL9
MQKRDSASRLTQGAPLGRQVRFGTTVRHSIPYKVLCARGWKEVDDDSWDFFYADVGWIHENVPYASTGSQGLRLSEHQRVNHFPNHVELTRKDLMAKNVKRSLKGAAKNGLDPAEYDFIPTTFILPNEGAMMLRHFRENGGMWIMKPIGRAQGKGIFLASKPNQIEAWMRDRGTQKAENCCYENYVAQRYLDDPYLVGGKKFDMRIYAVCLSYNPLKVYLYREGFARFTNVRYSMSKADIDNPYVHLTNHAIQKKDEAYDAETTDLKWSIGELKRFMTTKHGAEAVNACFAGIQSIIVNSLRSVSNVIINDKHCFEMYGYDVMLDADLKPWLIEVNASPSMSSDTQTDHDLKFGLLDDMLTLVDVENHFAGRAPRRVGGFDLICENGAETRGEEFGALPTMLGTHNDRLESLKRLRRWCTRGDPAKADAASKERDDEGVRGTRR